jgi:beta-phosphoglucomutase family hydrolase
MLLKAAVRSNSGGVALVFDMDGVLIDSNPLHRKAWEAYNHRYGIETTGAMHQRMYGRHNDDIVRDFFGSHLSLEDVRAHAAAKERLYRDLMTESLEQSLVPGVKEFIAARHHWPMAVASNAEQENVDFVLDGAGLRAYFRVVVHGNEVVNPKPHPEIYLHTADLLGVEPSRCVVFEDSQAGVAAAIAAGTRVVGVSTTHEELPGVALQISDFNDPALESWLGAQSDSA